MKDPELIIIVAASLNDVIGANGKIPWNIPEDRRRFKDLTLHHPVIMGRKTYDSLDERFKPLPERKNIVLSTSLEGMPGIYVAKNIRESLELAEGQDTYIIGGESIYRQFMHLTSKIELTRVQREYQDGDAFFPEIDSLEWKLEGDSKDDVSLKTGIPYSFRTYTRI